MPRADGSPMRARGNEIYSDENANSYVAHNGGVPCRLGSSEADNNQSYLMGDMTSPKGELGPQSCLLDTRVPRQTELI